MATLSENIKLNEKKIILDLNCYSGRPFLTLLRWITFLAVGSESIKNGELVFALKQKKIALSIRMISIFLNLA